MPSHPSLAQTVFPCCTRRVRTLTCLFFNLVAAACLGPGLSLPLLTVIVKVGDVELLRQSRSTLGTVRFLRSEGALLPAVAIALFSVFVPIFKFLVLMIIAVAPSMTWRRHMYLFVRNWSKWRSVEGCGRKMLAASSDGTATRLAASQELLRHPPSPRACYVSKFVL